MRRHIATKTVRGLTLAGLFATSVGAEGVPTTFEALAVAGIEASIAERETWEGLYPSYLYVPEVLLETAQLEMEIWAEVDGALANTGEIVPVPVELIGIYDFGDRTFTWGWASDDYPALPRTAVLATRAFGETHGIAELTQPTRQDRPVSGGVSGDIASVIGDLIYTDTLRTNEQPPRMIIYGVSGDGANS